MQGWAVPASLMLDAVLYSTALILPTSIVLIAFDHTFFNLMYNHKKKLQAAMQ